MSNNPSLATSLLNPLVLSPRSSARIVVTAIPLASLHQRGGPSARQVGEHECLARHARRISRAVDFQEGGEVWCAADVGEERCEGFLRVG